MEEIIEKIYEYFLNPEAVSPTFAYIFSVLRIIFITVSVLMVGMIIFLVTKSPYLQFRFREKHTESWKRKPYQEIKIDKDWNEILRQAKDEDESERKLAVIEADDLINDVLSQLGYEGETLLEKLSGLTKEIIPNIEDVRSAHKERRDMVYDPNKNVSKEEATKLISTYEEVFKDLQIF